MEKETTKVNQFLADSDISPNEILSISDKIESQKGDYGLSFPTLNRIKKGVPVTLTSAKKFLNAVNSILAKRGEGKVSCEYCGIVIK